MNRQDSPALQHKVSNRISDPSLPPRSESFSSGGIQQARTPPMHRSVEPQVSTPQLQMDGWMHGLVDGWMEIQGIQNNNKKKQVPK